MIYFKSRQGKSNSYKIQNQKENPKINQNKSRNKHKYAYLPFIAP